MDEKFDLDSIDKTFTRFKVGAKVEATVVTFLKSGILVKEIIVSQIFILYLHVFIKNFL